MRWIHKLEYKFGKYYIRNLMLAVVVGMVVVYLGDMILGGSLVSATLSFWRADILRGQVWRVLSFAFVPPGGNYLPPIAGLQTINNVMQPVFVLLSVYFTYMAGKFLEGTWGGFKFNMYFFSGVIMAIIGGFITPLGFSTNNYLQSSLFLAVATIMPEMQFRLFLLIPIKGWIFLVIFFAMNLFSIIQAFMIPAIGTMLGLSNLILFALSLVPYFLFFGNTLIGKIKQQRIISRNRRQWQNRNR